VPAGMQLFVIMYHDDGFTYGRVINRVNVQGYIDAWCAGVLLMDMDKSFEHHRFMVADFPVFQ
jgi:hypothetical protein